MLHNCLEYVYDIVSKFKEVFNHVIDIRKAFVNEGNINWKWIFWNVLSFFSVTSTKILGFTVHTKIIDIDSTIQDMKLPTIL